MLIICVTFAVLALFSHNLSVSSIPFCQKRAKPAFCPGIHHDYSIFLNIREKAITTNSLYRHRKQTIYCNSLSLIQTLIYSSSSVSLAAAVIAVTIPATTATTITTNKITPPINAPIPETNPFFILNIPIKIFFRCLLL